MLRQLQIFALQGRLRRVDHALDRLQVRYTSARRVGGDFAAQRLQHEFDNLAIDRALVANRLQQLDSRGAPNARGTVRSLTGSHSAPGTL